MSLKDQPPVYGESKGIPSSPQRTPVRISIPHPTQNPTFTYILLGVTVLIFFLQYATNKLIGYDLPLLLGAKVNEAIRAGEFWRLVTPVFLHMSLIHIGFNMYALYVIGRGLEQQYGHTRYLLLYFISGLSGNILSYIMSSSPSAGASTAIFGLVAAEGIFILRNRFLFGDRSRGMLVNIGTIVVINLMLGLSPGIDNWGHLGGLIGGLVFAWFAGPLLSIEGAYPSFSLVDGHTSVRLWLVSLIEVSILFGLIILLIASGH